MNRALQIAVDLEQGEIRLGTESVRLLPVAGDVFCLNDARGPLVRALKFEERARLLSEGSDRDVASLVADAALVSSGVATEEIRIAASLALAGGGEEAPAFPECVRFVEQRYGWDEKRIAESMALVIDRLCSPLVQQDASGWKQIVFQKSDADLGTLISQMASNLSQRAVAADRKISAEPETAQRKNSPLTSPQPSRSTNSSDFESELPSSSPDGSFESVSSVLPVRRSPFRVLAVKTDKTTQFDSTVIASSSSAYNADSETPASAFSEFNEIPAAATRSQSALLSTAIAAAAVKTDFPPAPKPQSNRVQFSQSQAAAAPAKIERSSPLPVASFPSWQPFATSSSNVAPSSEPVGTSPRAFPVAAPETQSSQDWLAEVAQLLEVECDLRGIDP